MNTDKQINTQTASLKISEAPNTTKATCENYNPSSCQDDFVAAKSGTKSNNAKPESLLDELQNLLVKQRELIKRGNIKDVELLCKQANLLVDDIARTGILEQAEHKDRREHLQELYKNLCLAIEAQKADISKKLSRIRKGKKTIGAYRNNEHHG